MTTDPVHKELPQTSFALLGLLNFQPMSGYDIKQFADKSIGHFYWSPAKSQIYAELRRLTGAGLATEAHVEQEGRPDKRIYEITEAGRLRLAEWVNSEEIEPDVFKSTVMLRVFFGHAADPTALLRILEQSKMEAHERLALLEGMEQQCVESDEDVLFSLMTIRGGIHLTHAAINWANESIEALNAQSSRQAGRGKSKCPRQLRTTGRSQHASLRGQISDLSISSAQRYLSPPCYSFRWR